MRDSDSVKFRLKVTRRPIRFDDSRVAPHTRLRAALSWHPVGQGGAAPAPAPPPVAVARRSCVPVRTPNAVHAGIYAALARGYDRAAGVRLRVVAPTASTDSIKLLEAGRVSFAVLDIHDLAIARQGEPTSSP